MLAALGISSTLLACSTITPPSSQPTYSVNLEYEENRAVIYSTTSISAREPSTHIGSREIVTTVDSGYLSITLWSALDPNDRSLGAAETCAGRLMPAALTGAASRIRTYLNEIPHIKRIQFDATLVERGRTFNHTISRPLDTEISLSFLFPWREDQVDCRAWVLSVLQVFVHELAHAYVLIADVSSPNRLSEEVVAYSMPLCVLDQLPGIGHIDVESHFAFPESKRYPFDAVYRKFLDHVHSDLPDTEATLKGRVLAELQWRHLRQLNDNAEAAQAGRFWSKKYCAELARYRIDFSRRSYWNHTNC